MKTLLLLLFLLGCGLCPAADPAPQVRAKFEDSGEIWVGQRVTLVVELLAPGYFAGSPFFDLPGISGCLIFPPAGSPVVSSEQIDGASYTVQRHELMIFPKREGEISIPAFAVRFEFKRNPLDQQTVPATVKTPPLKLKVARPPGMPAGAELVSSRDLTVTESWKPQPQTNAKTGDAFVRTLSWSASDLPGMAFPPFKPEPIAGLGIYQADPLVEDHEERGELQGRRQDRITYVCKAGGHITIPALTLRWWDPEAKTVKQAHFPARQLDIAAPPPPPVPLQTRIAIFFREHRLALSCVLGGLVAVALLLRYAREPLRWFIKRLFPRHLSPLNPRS